MAYDKTQVAFIDTETTGLNPAKHDIWEIGLIIDNTEYEWQVRPPVPQTADPGALRVSRYYERRGEASPSVEVAEAVAVATANRHLVGAMPSFDAEFLSRFLGRNGYVGAWHYHLIDVEALAVGHLSSNKITLPWKSEDLSRGLGIDPDRFDRHTALGDARWAKAMFEAVMGSGT